ncbi:hypothetical protein GPECTOR_76g789 [Gonium pectorale]|uniref:Homologous recombination OB-fold protein OB-fold domain-containing protein n=1 Tax=Gonium pectorale TaxID=33097 RepID=A0A150G297_GONPE|nr:hypothetical protein GPECTOR_76g789 [Gonium pectorale]|eukprot:KXZ43968.1 hypothetical protein GPECTOR_76g789 [Gonium pectorale]
MGARPPVSNRAGVPWGERVTAARGQRITPASLGLVDAGGGLAGGGGGGAASFLGGLGADGGDPDFASPAWRAALETFDAESFEDARLLLPNTLRTAAGQPFRKVPRLLALVAALTPSPSGDAFAQLKDPEGQMGAALHRDVMDAAGGQLGPRAVLLLQQVTVISPCHGLCYLCVTADNVMRHPNGQEERSPQQQIQQQHQQQRHQAQLPFPALRQQLVAAAEGKAAAGSTGAGNAPSAHLRQMHAEPSIRPQGSAAPASGRGRAADGRRVDGCGDGDGEDDNTMDTPLFSILGKRRAGDAQSGRPQPGHQQQRIQQQQPAPGRSQLQLQPPRATPPRGPGGLPAAPQQGVAGPQQAPGAQKTTVQQHQPQQQPRRPGGVYMPPLSQVSGRTGSRPGAGAAAGSRPLGALAPAAACLGEEGGTQGPTQAPSQQEVVSGVLPPGAGAGAGGGGAPCGGGGAGWPGRAAAPVASALDLFYCVSQSQGPAQGQGHEGRGHEAARQGGAAPPVQQQLRNPEQQIGRPPPAAPSFALPGNGLRPLAPPHSHSQQQQQQQWRAFGGGPGLGLGGPGGGGAVGGAPEPGGAGRAAGQGPMGPSAGRQGFGLGLARAGSWFADDDEDVQLDDE